MSDIPKRYEHFLSPDGLRKLTQLMRSHFDSYPSKDKLYTDCKGLQYNGSVYNFGSEILLETNKLKMTRPPIRNLKYGKDTTFYFDIQYSSLIDTYTQQNMMVCNLKRDTLVASHQYHLEFNNVSEYIAIRSPNSSAGNRITPDSQKRVQAEDVFKDTFYKTSEFPILVESYIDENDNPVTINHEICIKDDKMIPTFYFHYNDLTERFVDSIDNGTLTTVELTDSMFDLPFIWFTTKSFEYLPVLDLSNNLDPENHPFLTFGTDGNGVSRIYPNCYDNNFPPYSQEDNHEWFLKIESRDGYRFIVDSQPGNRSLNYQIPLKSITLYYSYSLNRQPTAYATIEIPEDSEYVVYLEDIQKDGHQKWDFYPRGPQDWDYAYNTAPYACTLYESTDGSWVNSFTGNHQDRKLLPGFRIKFFNEYLYKWEPDLIGTVSGIHVDSTDERSNNGVIEKNGVSHNMGEFDGLPTYFQLQLDTKIHRSHVELYSIRDTINKYTQTPMDKQTAGLIVDSAIPQTELPSFLYGDPSIVYNVETSNEYKTIFDTIISETNVLSNIVYVDTETNIFGDRTDTGMKKYKQFFYHGSNFFSLDILSLNPSDEYGRGYVISNDPAKYTNNDETSYVKPARTIARIADIPTSIIHLTNVPNYAPSVLIDWNDSELSYVRMGCNYSTDDKTMVLNDSDNLVKYDRDVVYPLNYDLSTVLPNTGDRYKVTDNINRVMTLTFGTGGNTTMTIVEPGTEYTVDGVAKFNIGGRYFEINYTVDYGEVVTVEPKEPGSFTNINLANLGSNESTYYATTVEGDGHGLKIKLTIDENVWNQYAQHVEDYRDGLYLYKFDEYKHIWLWTYDTIDNEWNVQFQVTGPRVTPNPYDLNMSYSIDKRKLTDVYMMNLFKNNRKFFMSNMLDGPNCMYSYNKNINIPKSKVHMDDLSEDLKELNVNVQNTYFVIKPDDDSDNSILDVHVRYPFAIQDTRYGPYHETIIPRFNSLNLPSFFNTSNRLTYMIDSTRVNSQPDVLFYNPNETNVVGYNKISSDYWTIKSSHDMSLVDLIDEELTHSSTLYIANENIYRYNEYEVPQEYETLLNTLNGMTRDQLITFIRETYGDDAVPLLYENNRIPYSKKMLVNYCMMITNTLYKKPDIKMIVQKYQTVAQDVEQDDGTSTVVPTIENQCSGLMKTISSNVSELDYHPDAEISIESDILFIFTIPKNDQLVSFKHFRLYDENGVDISNRSLLIYNGKKYLFNEPNENWHQIT